MGKMERKNIKYPIGSKLQLIKAIECSDFQEGDIVEVKTARYMYDNYKLDRINGRGLVSVKFADCYGYIYKSEKWIKI